MFNRTNDEALCLRLLFPAWQRNLEMAKLKPHFSQVPSLVIKTEINAFLRAVI